ncbi:hypothetical protein [Neobacillus niacini]|uniref:hypothetical protein n=1 Tax=Neobacillus niacini TaxID=86668 RepID=UPI003983D3D3
MELVGDCHGSSILTVFGESAKKTLPFLDNKFPGKYQKVLFLIGFVIFLINRLCNEETA